MLRGTVLNKQAVPGSIGDLKGGIDGSRNQKMPEILGEGPYKTGDAPGDGVKDHSCPAPPHFVSQGASDKCKKNPAAENQVRG